MNKMVGIYTEGCEYTDRKCFAIRDNNGTNSICYDIEESKKCVYHNENDKMGMLENTIKQGVTQNA